MIRFSGFGLQGRAGKGETIRAMNWARIATIVACALCVNASTATPGKTELRKKIEEIEKQYADDAKKQDPSKMDGSRKRFFGAKVTESRFAEYLERAMKKVEQVGSLNYPAEAKQRKLHGTLQLTFDILANGDLGEVYVSRTSGHEILDDAAKRIVRLAAPFEPFPEAIKRDTDLISVTRTWSFERDNELIAP